MGWPQGNGVFAESGEGLLGGSVGRLAIRRRIEERKERIKRAVADLDSARRLKVTERQWVEFYDKCFEIGEMEAVRWLAGITGKGF